MATSVEHLVGGFFVLVLLAIMLYGILTTQAYVYWWNYANDSRLSRWTVAVLMILETIHTGFCFAALYDYVIIDFNDVLKVDDIVWTYATSVIAAIIVATIVQSFFIHRIWILSKRSVLITSIPAFLLFFKAVLGLATASYMYKLRTWAEFRGKIMPLSLFASSLSLAAAVDLIISTMLIVNLQQSRTGSHRTDHIIKLVQLYAINTGALTMLVSLAIILTFALLKDSLVFAGLVEVQSKLYTIAFLATLNARQHWRVRNKNVVHEIISMEMSPRMPAGQDPTSPLVSVQFFSNDYMENSKQHTLT